MPLSVPPLHSFPTMPRPSASYFILALAAFVTSAHAQSIRAFSSLSAGDRVRYTLNVPERDRYVGVFATAANDSLYLRADFDTTAIPLSLQHVARLEVSVGKDTHFRRDALYGAVVGAASWMIVVAAKPQSSALRQCPATVLGNCFEAAPTRDYPRAAVEGGLTGVILGLGLACIDRTDHWLIVSLPSHAVGSIAGSAVGVRMSF